MTPMKCAPSTISPAACAGNITGKLSYERRHGLPIGNLTSQFFANVYLNGFDQFVKERLLVRFYLRYVDDFALFGADCWWLAEARKAIEEYLASLRLRIHPIKSQLFETRHGVNFVVFRSTRNHQRRRRCAHLHLKLKSRRLYAGGFLVWYSYRLVMRHYDYRLR